MARRTTSKTGTTKRATASRGASDKTQTEPLAEQLSDESTPSAPTPDAAPESVTEQSGQAEVNAPDAAVAQNGNDTAQPDSMPDGDTPSGAEPLDATSSDADTKQADPATPTDVAQDQPAETGAEARLADSDATPSATEPSVQDDLTQAQTPHSADAAQPEPTVAAVSAPPAKRGGFVPMLLGGLVAGGIGYGAHYVQTNQGAGGGELALLRTEMAELRNAVAQPPDLSAIEAQIAALGTTDLAPVESAIDDLRSQLAALPVVEEDTLQARLDALRSDLTVDLGPLQDSIAALEDAYAPLPAQIAALQADMTDLRDLANTQVSQAEAAVDSALAMAGLDRIRAAFVTGAAFEDAAAQLAQAGVSVPDPLTQSAANGIATLESLQDSYDAAARAAITASLQDAPADSATEKLGNFFRAQIGARSLAPRDGDAPDAITARAGAALVDGDLQAARAELAALPEAGLAAMADWLGAADARLKAATALDALQAQITTD